MLLLALNDEDAIFHSFSISGLRIIVGHYLGISFHKVSSSTFNTMSLTTIKISYLFLLQTWRTWKDTCKRSFFRFVSIIFHYYLTRWRIEVINEIIEHLNTWCWVMLYGENTKRNWKFTPKYLWDHVSFLSGIWNKKYNLEFISFTYNYLILRAT